MTERLNWTGLDPLSGNKIPHTAKGIKIPFATANPGTDKYTLKKKKPPVTLRWMVCTVILNFPNGITWPSLPSLTSPLSCLCFHLPNKLPTWTTWHCQWLIFFALFLKNECNFINKTEAKIYTHIPVSGSAKTFIYYILHPRTVPLSCHQTLSAVGQWEETAEPNSGEWSPGSWRGPVCLLWFHRRGEVKNTEAASGWEYAPPRYYISQWELWPQNEETMR